MQLHAVGFIRCFGQDKRGAIIIVFAFALLVLVGMIGGAVDYGRWLKAKTSTQAAMDAAVLAAGRVMQIPGTSKSDALAAAQKYYDKNKSAVLSSDNVAFSTSPDGAEIIATSVASQVKTPFLGLMGLRELPVNATSKALLGPNSGSNLEVSLMLDTTGSMYGQKMIDLQAAAKDLIDIVIGDGQSNGNTRIALAPFSRYVNVGATYFSAITGSTAGGGLNERTCVKERSNSDRYTDASPSVGGLFDPYLGTGTCSPTVTIMPLTNDAAALKAQIDSFPTSDLTAGHLGTAWAWYLLSPNWSGVWTGDSTPKPYAMLTETNGNGTPRLRKIAVLMTDGAYNTEYSGESSTTQARAICTNIKNEGIIVYTIGFAITVGSSPDLIMQHCASSSEHYYNAANGEALKAAFRDIALKIATLRLSE